MLQWKILDASLRWLNLGDVPCERFISWRKAYLAAGTCSCRTIHGCEKVSGRANKRCIYYGYLGPLGNGHNREITARAHFTVVVMLKKIKSSAFGGRGAHSHPTYTSYGQQAGLCEALLQLHYYTRWQCAVTLSLSSYITAHVTRLTPLSTSSNLTIL